MTEKKYGDSYGEVFRQYEDRIVELEKKNTELKKAKEIIKGLLILVEMDNREYEDIFKQAELFLKIGE